MNNIIKDKIQAFLDLIKPVKNVAFFLFLFLLFEFLWKVCVNIGEDGRQLVFLGIDLTSAVRPISDLDTRIVYVIIHDLLGYKTLHMDGITLFFEGSMRLDIVWSCTSIKQLLLFTFIMIFYPGPRKSKYKFLLLSLLFLCFVNTLRLVAMVFLVKDGFPDWFIPVNEILNDISWNDSRKTYWAFYADWFHFFHDGFFRWVYYDGIMFLIWLLWEEKFNLPFQKTKQEETKA